MQVNYDEVIRVLDYLDIVNGYKLKEIEWVRDDGTKIEVNPKVLEHWRFVGMSNHSFVEMILCEIVAGKEKEILEEFGQLICEHPNASYYGDTNPTTYKCPDCGLVFVKG